MDYFTILKASIDDSPKELNKKYKKLATLLHPDKHPEKDKAKYEEKFKKVKEAYEVLKDKEKRKKYINDLYKIKKPAYSYPKGDGGYIYIYLVSPSKTGNGTGKYPFIEGNYKIIERLNGLDKHKIIY
jgi:curved DNA-binding protein CbpA